MASFTEKADLLALKCRISGAASDRSRQLTVAAADAHAFRVTI